MLVVVVGGKEVNLAPESQVDGVFLAFSHVSLGGLELGFNVVDRDLSGTCGKAEGGIMLSE
jgi:hypothetical protein